MEFLQGAFQTYKTQTLSENNTRLQEQQAQLSEQHNQELQAKLREQGTSHK